MIEYIKAGFKRCKDRGDLVVSLFFLFSGLYFLYLTKNLPKPYKQIIGPDFFPSLILGLWIILSIWLIIRNIRMPEKINHIQREHGKNFWITIVFMFSYALLLNYIGFLVLTLVSLFLFLYCIGVRNWKILISCSVGLSFAILIMFPMIMSIPLPRGVWIFRELSYFFY